jgi:hypothetical protein
MSYAPAVDVVLRSPHSAWPRLQWRYFKDAGASGGEDAGWVDKFEWTGSSQPAEMPGNTGQLYAKVNGVKVAYPDDVADITWRKWSIELGSLGVDLQAVRTLAIGIDGDGAVVVC